jgi:hypothetical protein
MKRFACLSLASLLVSAAALPAAWAQTPTDPDLAPPKVLVIFREFTKPGKSGSVHEKSETNFVKAMQAAKWPVHYLGMESVTGINRALFLTGYDSYDAWQKDNDAQAKNAALSAANDHAWTVDGELLASTDASVWNFRGDLSLAGSSPIDIATMRYMEIMQFKAKPGHEQEFEEVVKMYKTAYGKAAPSMTWAVYENQYGHEDGDVYLVMFPRKSLAEIDKGFSDDKTVMTGLGDAGQKKIAELTAASTESSQVNLFHFNPKMSYMSDRAIATDPSFWKPKPAAAPKPAAPAQ